MNFIDMCLSGEILADEIDDFVDRWHDEQTEETELHEYLGMPWEEYSLWATKPSLLSSILAARNKHIELESELEHERLALAARAETAEEAKALEKWLKQIGKH